MRRRTLHQLGINLISNLGSRLPVSFGSVTRFKLCFRSLDAVPIVAILHRRRYMGQLNFAEEIRRHLSLRNDLRRC